MRLSGRSIAYIAADKPSKPSPVVVTQASGSTSVKFSWTIMSSSNGLPVTLHRLKILKKNATPEDYVEDTSVCNAGIPASTFCTVPMTTLISTFGYAAGDVIMAKLTAVNARGEGPASADSNIDIVAQVAPTAALTGFAATSAAGDVTLTWTKLTDGAQTGYSPITDYVITYQSTSNTLHTITVTDETASSYVIQNLTPAGELFTYTIKTVNIHGTSTAVATATNTLAGTAPTTLASPTVTQSGTNVVITWTPTSSNNGAVVNSYKLYIFDYAPTTDEFVNHIDKCQGYTALSTTCTIPMSTFTSTLQYTIGQPIRVKATATNSVGESTQSGESNTDVVAQSTPTISVSNLAATSTVTSITLTWSALTDGAQTGYSSVTSYKITHDNGTPGNTADDPNTKSSSKGRW